MDTNDQRLIEHGFPCHQVGAETQRERGASSALPPLYFLHVWWARRPLTPSRAAIVASLDSAATDPEVFVRQLGIERVEALVHEEPWTLTGDLLARIELDDHDAELLQVDDRVLRRLQAEDERRAQNRVLIDELKAKNASLASDPVLQRWEAESQPLPQPWPEGGYLPVQRVMGDPAWAKQLIAFTKAHRIRFEGDAYSYPRAFTNQSMYSQVGIAVLDPTSGGGSIPFEALRLGHNVIANELNPVATIILHATLDFPARFGPNLAHEIQKWGNQLLTVTEGALTVFYPNFMVLPFEEQAALRSAVTTCPESFTKFNQEHILDYIYARQVTCPHCGGEAPLLNTCWLSKESGNQWGIRIVTDGQPRGGTVTFQTYHVVHGHGPNE
jgi:adenine-specific DNA methylase